MKATIQKWGNSLALRLPKALAEEAKIRAGSKVELVSTPEGVLVKARRKPRYRLSDLLSRVTPENIHTETGWGSSVGREHGSQTAWRGRLALPSLTEQGGDQARGVTSGLVGKGRPE
jgi:antitoxin MazE